MRTSPLPPQFYAHQAYLVILHRHASRERPYHDTSGGRYAWTRAQSHRQGIVLARSDLANSLRILSRGGWFNPSTSTWILP